MGRQGKAQEAKSKLKEESTQKSKPVVDRQQISKLFLQPWGLTQKQTRDLQESQGSLLSQMESLMNAQTNMNREFEDLNKEIEKTRFNISRMHEIEDQLQREKQSKIVSMQHLFSDVMDVIYNLEQSHKLHNPCEVIEQLFEADYSYNPNFTDDASNHH